MEHRELRVGRARITASITGVLACMIGAACAGGAVAVAQEKPTPQAGATNARPQLPLKQITATGSGCPAGTWTSKPINDPYRRPGIKLEFTGYRSANKQTRNCDITLTLDGADGTSFAPVGLGTTVPLTMAWQTSPQDLVTSEGFFTRAIWSACSGERVLNVSSKLTGATDGSSIAAFSMYFLPRSCALPPAAGAQEATPPAPPPAKGAIAISGVFSSPGCPWLGAFSIAKDKTSATVTLDGFSLPRSSTFTPYSRLCTFEFVTTSNAGQAASVAAITAEGVSQLEAGTTAEFVTTEEFPRSAEGNILIPEGASRSILTGATPGAFTHRHEIRATDTTFDACGRERAAVDIAVNLGTQEKPIPEGAFSLTKLTFQLVPRDCKPAASDAGEQR